VVNARLVGGLATPGAIGVQIVENQEIDKFCPTILSEAILQLVTFCNRLIILSDKLRVYFNQRK